MRLIPIHQIIKHILTSRLWVAKPIWVVQLHIETEILAHAMQGGFIVPNIERSPHRPRTSLDIASVKINLTYEVVLACPPNYERRR